MTGNRLWMLGVSLVAVMIVVFGWLFGIYPALSQADLATSQAQSTDAQNAAQRAALVKLKSQYEKLPDLEKELAGLQLSVPESSNLDDFLDQLQGLAQANGVTITAFTAAEATVYGGGAPGAAPTAPTPTASAAPTQGETPAATPQKQSGVVGSLFTVPITVAVKGTPGQIMAFTDAAQKGTRFFLVTADSFTGATPPGEGTGTLTGFVFVMHETGSAAASTTK